MPDLSFITTCRGRLDQLKQSLPTFAQQPNSSCIVVDYGCPEGTADWVEQSFPDVRVVRAGAKPRFELSKARNLGAKFADARWLCFVDADICLSPDFSTTVQPLLKRGNYYLATGRTIESWGTNICHRGDFRRIEGYDDVIQGWGAEDNDFYTRLRIIGNRLRTFPAELIHSVISHDEQVRTKHYAVKDQWLNATANRIYCQVKWDLIRLRQKNLPHDERKQLYDSLYPAILKANATGEPLEVKIAVFRGQTATCGPLEADIVYRLPLPQQRIYPPSKASASSESSS